MKPQCLCGQAISFPKRKTVSRCKVCGVRWERDKSGCWAKGFRSVIFTPFVTRLKASKVKSREEKYENYPKTRRKKH